MQTDAAAQFAILHAPTSFTFGLARLEARCIAALFIPACLPFCRLSSWPTADHPQQFPPEEDAKLTTLAREHRVKFCLGQTARALFCLRSADCKQSVEQLNGLSAFSAQLDRSILGSLLPVSPACHVVSTQARLQPRTCFICDCAGPARVNHSLGFLFAISGKLSSCTTSCPSSISPT